MPRHLKLTASGPDSVIVVSGLSAAMREVVCLRRTVPILHSAASSSRNTLTLTQSDGAIAADGRIFREDFWTDRRTAQRVVPFASTVLRIFVLFRCGARRPAWQGARSVRLDIPLPRHNAASRIMVVLRYLKRRLASACALTLQ